MFTHAIIKRSGWLFASASKSTALGFLKLTVFNIVCRDQPLSGQTRGSEQSRQNAAE